MNEKRVDFFINLIIDSNKYKEKRLYQDFNKWRENLSDSFSKIHEYSHSESNIPYNLDYLNLICPERKDGILAHLEQNGKPITNAPSDLLGWRQIYEDKLLQFYQYCQKFAKSKVYCVSAIKETENGFLAPITYANYDSNPHHSYRILVPANKMFGDVEKVSGDAWELAAFYLTKFCDIKVVRNALKNTFINWTDCLFSETNKIEGQSFTFSFTALFLIVALQNLYAQKKIAICDKNNQKPIPLENIMLPQDIVMSGAFNSISLPDQNTWNKIASQTEIPTQAVEALKNKLKTITDINKFWKQKTQSDQKFFKQFLVSQNSQINIPEELKNNPHSPEIIKVCSLSDFVEKLFPNWIITKSQHKVFFIYTKDKWTGKIHQITKKSLLSKILILALPLLFALLSITLFKSIENNPQSKTDKTVAIKNLNNDINNLLNFVYNANIDNPNTINASAILKVGTNKKKLHTAQPNESLPKGSKYQIAFHTKSPCWVYIFEIDAKGSCQWLYPKNELFPELSRGENKAIEANKTIIYPSRKEVAVLDDAIGIQHFYLVFVKERWQELEKYLVKAATNKTVIGNIKERNALQIRGTETIELELPDEFSKTFGGVQGVLIMELVLIQN